jgi:hypothetical protein
VDDPLTAHKACQSTSLGRTHWAHLARGFDKTLLPVGSSKTEFFSVADEQHGEYSTAQYVRLFEDYLEYWGQIAGRGVDHLQHLSDRCALIQRLVALGRALGKLTFEIGYPLIGIG